MHKTAKHFNPANLINTRWKSILSLALVLIWLMFIISNYYKKMWDSSILENINLPTLPDFSNLPYVYEAIGRVGISILGTLCLISSATIIGALILKSIKWNYKSFSEGVVFSIAIGIGVLSYIGFALALIGLYKEVILRIIVLISILVGIWFWLHSKRQRLLHFNRISLLNKKEVIWWILVGIAVLFALSAALAPEKEFDALWYHLAYPQRYLKSGGLVDTPEDYVSLYPMTWELWFGYGLAFGGQITAKLLHFSCLLITGFAITSFVRRFFSETSSALSIALFVTIPTVIWEASTAYIDLAIALYILLMLYALLVYQQEKNRSWLIVAALSMGLALACKHLSLIVLILASAGIIFYDLIKKQNLKHIFLQILLFNGIALAIALPWYIRSIIVTGNPFFPELYKIFGAPPERWDAVTQSGLQNFLNHFGPPRTIINYLTLPWQMTVHAARFDGSLGPVFLILLPFLIFVRRKTKYHYLLLIFVFFYFIFWASPLSSFQMRFLIPIMPLLAILGASAFTSIEKLKQSKHKIMRFIPHLFLSILLILNLPPFTALHEHDRIGWDNWLNSVLHNIDLNIIVGGESVENYLSKNIASYGVWNFANKNISKNAYVLTCSNGDQFYSKRKRIWIYSASAMSITRTKDEAAALSALQSKDITDLILNKHDKYALKKTIFLPATIKKHYKKLYEDQSYILFHIR